MRVPRVRFAMRGVGVVAVLAALFLLAPSCTPGPSSVVPCGRATAPPVKYDHVVVLVEENRTWSGGGSPKVGLGFSATDMPFLHQVAKGCTYFGNWKETNPKQNSLTQYIGMTSGVDNPNTVNDCNPSATCRSTDNNIFRQVRAHGGTARTFVEGATKPCSTGSNAAKHVPALYYKGGTDAAACAAEVWPLGELDTSALPTFTMIVPSLCNDGHDCPNSTVDAFAKKWLTPILNGADYRKSKTLVVVIYDEDEPVPNLLIAPTAHAGVILGATGSHAALLKTIELALGLPVMQQGQLPTAISLRKPAHL